MDKPLTQVGNIIKDARHPAISDSEMEEAFRRQQQQIEQEAGTKVAKINSRRLDSDWQTSQLQASGVPIRFLKAKISDYSDKFARQQLHQYCTNNKSGIFTGDTGTGKTHLAVAFMRARIQSKSAYWEPDSSTGYKIIEAKIPLFIGTPKLLVDIRGTFGHSDETTQMIDKYINCESLVLDDLGAEKTTDWSMEVLYLIVDARYSNMKQLLVTSNLNIENIASKLGDRIASRLAGLGFVLNLEGKDRRLQK